ncbi:hypothetical protein T08_9540 [Trichinella sp. T8]|nr:hypothetical protein T08_9540 [Trichinella sp. T8]
MQSEFSKIRENQFPETLIKRNILIIAKRNFIPLLYQHI